MKDTAEGDKQQMEI